MNDTLSLFDSQPQINATLNHLNHDELTALAKSCTDCKLAQTRQQVVFFDGNPEAKLMIIGEGPGEKEDESGIPFVGKAGRLLDKILESANIDRKTQTYICNIVKCRPPANRVPEPDEVLACSKYLQAQLALVKPKLLLLLGSTAVAGILKHKAPKMTKLHGLWIDSDLEHLQGIKIMPFYHPSYLLRNGSRLEGSPKAQAWQAIRFVAEKLAALG